MASFFDPEKAIYAEFGLRRGSPVSLALHPRIWWRGLRALVKGYGLGQPSGDPWPIPGVFLVERAVARSYTYKTNADLPDFRALFLR